MTASEHNPRDLGQKAYWAAQKKRRRPFHPAAAGFARPKAEIVADAIEAISSRPSNQLDLLEVGCGNGFFSVWLKALFRRITLLDFSAVMLRQNPIGAGVLGSAENIPFGDNAFDVVFCSNLLHHMPDPVIAVREMARVSRRFVALSEPNRNNPLMFLFGLVKPAERGAIKFSRSYLESVARQAGLAICKSVSHGAVLPNRTPPALVPLVKQIEPHVPFKSYNIVVGEKVG